MNIFLDCGFYAGVALHKYIDAGVVDNSWKVYAFEASPEIEINTYPWVEVIRKAVWTDTGEVTFQIGGRNDASSVQGTSGHGNPKLVTVPSIDFSHFVAKLPKGFIICSMDIEGSEYRVLEKMLNKGTIDRINILDIEFHDRLMLDKTIDDSQELIDKLIIRTAIRLKVPLI